MIYDQQGLLCDKQIWCPHLFLRGIYISESEKNVLLFIANTILRIVSFSSP